MPGLLWLPGYSGLDRFPGPLATRGLAVLAIDVRGQGDSTRDFQPEGEGVLTHGLDAPEHHAYRGVLLDCLRALEVLRAHPLVDASRIGVAGASQGGGLALAVGALSPQLRVVAAEVPFLCDIVRSATVVETEPLAEWQRWCAAHPRDVARAAATLAYVDVANFVADIRCPTFLAYSPADQICPVDGLHTVMARLRCPLTVRRYGPGHNAPLLRRYRRIAESWLVHQLTSPQSTQAFMSPCSRVRGP